MTNQTSEQFWEQRYQNMTGTPNGRPTAKLVEYAADLPAGRALDLGCSRGDDVIWLASRGWQATGVDISATALGVAAERAKAAGVSDRVRWERHDLAESFPAGEFELVTALYFQSPIAFPRAQVLRRAAAAVASRGVFLLVEHSTAAPWSFKSTTPFSTVEETLASLELDESWEPIFVGAPARQAKGPHGETAEVLDNVVVMRKRAA
ncbi:MULTISPECIES: methyltransferase domain-containing protein [unclassified Devosia]|uniref:SAM-dependent methyltransferase n=1 Tax=unclassified Devosia TaxID=196773 RepID=UPI0015526CEC|nr:MULTISPECIES: methyltransferase domain-containing protein [unclassified Devosia]